MVQQRRKFMSLPPEVHLLIAQQVDRLWTSLALSQTCRYFRSLLRSGVYLRHFMHAHAQYMAVELRLGVPTSRFDEYWFCTGVVGSGSNGGGGERAVVVHWHRPWARRVVFGVPGHTADNDNTAGDDEDELADQILVYICDLSPLGRVHVKKRVVRSLRGQLCLRKVLNGCGVAEVFDTRITGGRRRATPLDDNSDVCAHHRYLATESGAREPLQECRFFHSLLPHHYISKNYRVDLRGWDDWFSFTFPSGQHLKIILTDSRLRAGPLTLRLNPEREVHVDDRVGWWNRMDFVAYTPSDVPAREPDLSSDDVFDGCTGHEVISVVKKWRDRALTEQESIMMKRWLDRVD